MSDAATVMIVGVDKTASARLADDILADTGLRGMVANDAAAARSLCAADHNGVAMAIVDTGLPDGGGPILCAQLVEAHKGLPVLMISPAYSETEALECLRAGAIDYFPRPHQRAELVARLRAHLRSRLTSLEVELTVGPFRFHPGQRLLVDERKQARIWLTAKEARIFRRLHAANGGPVGKAELWEVAWGSKDVSVHTLQTHIYRLRTKLNSGAPGRPLLLTTSGGYVLDV